METRAAASSDPRSAAKFGARDLDETRRRVDSGFVRVGLYKFE